MLEKPSRREVLTYMTATMGALAIVPMLGGCREVDGPEVGGDGSDLKGGASPQSDSTGTPTTPVELAFEDSEDFYSDLGRHLQEGQEVRVIFDGSVRLREDSPFVTEWLAEAENASAVVEKVHRLDTTAGRNVMRRTFPPGWLQREPVTSEVKVGNDVVEPGTVILVGVVILATAVAMAVGIQATRYAVEIETRIPDVFEFRFKPVA